MTRQGEGAALALAFVAAFIVSVVLHSVVAAVGVLLLAVTVSYVIGIAWMTTSTHRVRRKPRVNATATRAEATAPPTKPGTSTFGLGVFLLVSASALVAAATILIWCGIFPGLAVLIVAVPAGTIGIRLVRKGTPATTLDE
jgi:hypothetical protein